jgi:hypothetical protein
VQGRSLVSDMQKQLCLCITYAVALLVRRMHAAYSEIQATFMHADHTDITCETSALLQNTRVPQHTAAVLQAGVLSLHAIQAFNCYIMFLAVNACVQVVHE